jgi:electron transport complex protein RnfE
MIMHAYLPELYEMMGVYLALIVVNCIILGRAEMYARKNTVLDSALDGLGMGIGFLIALVAMATIREVFGLGTFAGIKLPILSDYNIPLLVQAPGGFLVYGILIAIVNKIGPKAGAEKRKNFSCEGCPSAAFCGKVSCVETAEITVNAEENTTEEKKEANE